VTRQPPPDVPTYHTEARTYTGTHHCDKATYAGRTYIPLRHTANTTTLQPGQPGESVPEKHSLNANLVGITQANVNIPICYDKI